MTMAAQNSNWGKELRMGDGERKASKRRSVTGRLSGGHHHSKPEDFMRTGRRSDGLTNEEDSKPIGARSKEDVRRKSNDQNILGGPKSKSTPGHKPEDLEAEEEAKTKSKEKVKCDASSEETVLSVNLMSGAEKLDDETRLYQSPGGQAGPEDQMVVAVVTLQNLSVSEEGERETTIERFRENNVATQFQKVTNQKLSHDICKNEPKTIVSLSSQKSLRI